MSDLYYNPVGRTANLRTFVSDLASKRLFKVEQFSTSAIQPQNSGVFRLSQWYILCLHCTEIWCRVPGRMVPEILRKGSGLNFQGRNVQRTPYPSRMDTILYCYQISTLLECVAEYATQKLVTKLTQFTF